MRIVSLSRFPVKAMGGESLESVEVDARGLVGDRALAVVDASGLFAAGKRGSRWRPFDGIFAYSAALRDDAVVVSRGGSTWEARSPELDAELSDALGEPLRVAAEASGERPFFDSSPVSLVGTASLEWVARSLGVEEADRRLRVNVVVETSEPFEEESWIGSVVTLGEVSLRVTKRNARCRVIDQAQNGVESNARFLKPLGAERDACLAVYAEVVTPGMLRVG